ncbi:carboxymuconolactone decarboxylase family protein [Fundidesulfovibrio agrisoli]|uniref:carboxymuconolactone decarboxylase family protein n=1 Tax=Fundidesulfovibrio agrisoli TaxID=2922717 RepID=UPI001FAD9292|nr:carboxymuconolactone decarboxylase family protein [Fundidesulfovibrio agrisoli]
MKDELKPKHYEIIRAKHPAYIEAVENLGKAVHGCGPLDSKTLLLIQLGAAAASHSEGSVLSHARRALKAGASLDEIYHALIGLTSTIGFPTVAAAMSWVRKALDED